MGGHNDRRNRYEDYADERSVLHTDDQVIKKADTRTSVFNERRGRPRRDEVRQDFTVEPSGD